MADDPVRETDPPSREARLSGSATRPAAPYRKAAEAARSPAQNTASSVARIPDLPPVARRSRGWRWRTRASPALSIDAGRSTRAGRPRVAVSGDVRRASMSVFSDNLAPSSTPAEDRGLLLSAKINRPASG